MFGFRLTVAAALALAAVWPATAQRISFDDSFTQGGMVVGQAPAGARVEVNERPVTVSAAGDFVFGIGRDAKGPVTVTVHFEGARSRHVLPISVRDYDVQHIDGLPPEKVTPSKETLARIRKEQAAIDAARSRSLARSGFAGPWILPVAGTVTGVYGSQRVLNGEPRSPHYGLDIAAPEGTPVRAPADGVVTLVYPDMFFSGHTLILDHGHGVSSTLIHFSEILVEEGDEVAAGDVIAKVGATGRATGPHLHWGINWRDVRLDPGLLVEAEPGIQDPGLGKEQEELTTEAHRGAQREERDL